MTEFYEDYCLCRAAYFSAAVLTLPPQVNCQYFEIVRLGSENSLKLWLGILLLYLSDGMYFPSKALCVLAFYHSHLTLNRLAFAEMTVMRV